MLRMKTPSSCGVRLHADTVAENRTAGKRAGRIDRHHAHRLSGLPGLAHDAIDQRALARSGRSRDADEVGAAGVRKDVANQRCRRGRFVLDERHRASHCPRVAGEHTLGQRWGRGHVRQPATDAR